MAAFPGFPPQALDFYEDLEGDNTKSFWTTHRATQKSTSGAPSWPCS